MADLSKKRWYDANKTLSSSIQMLDAMPMEMQTLIAETMIVLAERECKADKLMDELKSLGAEVVLALYKSKNKRRSYDANPELHKAMNYLYILPDNNRTFMGEQIIEVITHVHDYLQVCKAAKADANMEEVARITRTFANLGSAEATKTVNQLKEHYGVLEMPADTVKEKESGMQIRDKK